MKGATPLRFLLVNLVCPMALICSAYTDEFSHRLHSGKAKRMTYDVSFEKTFQSRMLFVQEIDKKCRSSLVSFGQETFESG
jgi:hypothetical protein